MEQLLLAYDPTRTRGGAPGNLGFATDQNVLGGDGYYEDFRAGLRAYLDGAPGREDGRGVLAEIDFGADDGDFDSIIASGEDFGGDPGEDSGEDSGEDPEETSGETSEKDSKEDFGEDFGRVPKEGDESGVPIEDLRGNIRNINFDVVDVLSQPLEPLTHFVVDMEAPDTEAPDTEAPDTEAPDTEAPESEAPDTEAPESEAPEGILHAVVSKHP